MKTSVSAWSIKRLMDMHFRFLFVNVCSRHLGSYAIGLAAACRVHDRLPPLVADPMRNRINRRRICHEEIVLVCLSQTQVLVVSRDLSRHALEKNESPRSDPAKSTATTVTSECSAYPLSSLGKVLSIEVPIVGSMLLPPSFSQGLLSEISASAHSD